MKNIILLLLALVFFSQDILCNDGILSKFHQHIFKLKEVRMQLMSYNKIYINFFEIKAFKFNRTTTAHNGSINFKMNMSDKIEIIVQTNKFYSNEYRRFPARYQVNLQKCFEANALGISELSKCGNISSFYFYKDITYQGCNFVVDESHLPPLIPNGKYRTDFIFLFSNIEIALMYFYNEVYTPTVYPEN